jgi:hypothetical protein
LFRNAFLFSTAQLYFNFAAHATAQKNSDHTASLDELAEPIYYSNLLQTSSTRVFASQLTSIIRAFGEPAAAPYNGGAC